MPHFRLLIGLIAFSLGLHAQPSSNSILQAAHAQLEMDVTQLNKDLTITESTQSAKNGPSEIGANYDFSELGDSLTKALEKDEASHSNTRTTDARSHLRNTLIGFILELTITIIVLLTSFSLCGFPTLFYQIGLLSLAVALVGAGMNYFLSIGLANPIRIGLSFITLLILIRQLTDVREWATAIRISLIARLISLALMWLSFAAIMASFSL
jgi:heme/copper-type cytochrome/quinol oxidase subunit 4